MRCFAGAAAQLGGFGRRCYPCPCCRSALARPHKGEDGGGRREVAARAADGLDAGRGRRAGSAVGEAAVGGVLGVLDARRAEGHFGLAARPAGARTGRRGEAGARGPSALVSIYDSRDWSEAF